MLLNRALIASAILFCVSFSAIAEEAKTNVNLGKITITGTGTVRGRSDSPIQTTIIQKDAIEKKGAFSLYDALDGLPGVRVEEQCSACNFSQVRIQGMSSGNTKILINSLPLFTGLAGVYGLQQYLAANIDSIEIVKGAGSSLYGGDAVAGVINIIPADPSTKPFLQITSLFETHGTGVFSLSGSKRTKDWAIVGSVQRSYEGAIDENGDNLTDRVESDNFAGNVSVFWYNPFNFFDKITFFGSAINETRTGGDLTDGNWKNPFAEGTERIQTKRFETGISFLKNLNKKVRAILDAAYSAHWRDATNDTAQDDIFSTTTISNASQLPRPFLAEEELYFVNAKTVIKMGPASFANTISAGVQFRYSDFSQVIGQLAQRATTDKNATDFGVFVQDEISFNKKVDVVAGLRFDYHKSEEVYTNVTLDYDLEKISPRLAVSVNPTEKMKIRASIGTGFRVPYHFAEDLHLCSGSPRIYKGPGLKAESSVTATGSIQYGFTRDILLNVGYTMITTKDRLDFDSTAQPGYDLEWQNVGDATSHGVDVNLDWNVLKNLKIGANIAWTSAKYDENLHAGETYNNADKGDHVMRTPDLTGGLSVNWSPGKFDVYADLKYTGKMYIFYDSETPGSSEIVKTDPFIVANIRLAFQATESLSLFAGVKNLFDEVQTDKRTDDAAFIYGPYTGREVYGGASLKL